MNSRRLRRLPRASAALGSLFLFTSLSTGASANPPFVNTGFEVVGPAGSPTFHNPPAPGGAGQSAADGWGVFHNTAPAPTATEITPSTLPTGQLRMIHVETSGHANGLVQVNGPFGTGATRSITSGWVLVNSGTVGMGTGNGGMTGIDATTTTTGVWEFLQAPNGFSPSNEIVFYSVGGGADFNVDDVRYHEIQEFTFPPILEYSNDLDEQAVALGGDHAGPDPGQTLVTILPDGVVDDQPRDGVDFFPGIEDGEEPDAQIDALAHGLDFGFQRLVDGELDLLFSVEGDSLPAAGVAAYAELPTGVVVDGYRHRDLHALNTIGDIEDVDGLELWGEGRSEDDATDANFYSIERDLGFVSVWTTVNGPPQAYLTAADIEAQVNALGWGGSVDEIDLDALMVRDAHAPGVWDRGDEVMFSIRASNNFHGGEIVHWVWGQPATFLRHGGHFWDTTHTPTAPDGTELAEVDAIEVPEPGSGAMLAAGVFALAGAGGWRIRRRW